MIRPILAAAAFIACLLPANASPELAKEWSRKAAKLYSFTHELDALPKPESAYLQEFEWFSVTAARLAIWSDTANKPADFGCIFRGIAAESEEQVFTLLDAPGKIDLKTLKRDLSPLFSDAEMIGLSVIAANAQGEPDTLMGHASCAADSEAALQSLK